MLYVLGFKSVRYVVLPPLQRGCWRLRYKKKEVILTKVLADLVGNFCSFSERKRTESETSSLRFRQFTRSLLHAYTRMHTYVCTHDRTRDAHVRTDVATPTIILNFREENFRDQISNHEIHENIVP